MDSNFLDIDNDNYSEVIIHQRSIDGLTADTKMVMALDFSNIYDSIPPAITIHSPNNITYNTTSISLQVSANEAISVWWYKLNGGTNTTFTPNTTITAVQGDNNIIVYANDTAGNIGSSSVSFFVDMTVPTITIHSPIATTYTIQSIYVNVSANEAISVWWYKLNGGTNTTFTPNTTILAQNGSNTLYVYANDTVGNIGKANISFIVNIPTVTFLISPTNLYNFISPEGLPIIIDFNCSAVNDVNLTNITLYINGIPNETRIVSGIWNFAVFNKTISVGNYNWTCRSCDFNDECSFGVPIRTFTIYRPTQISILGNFAVPALIVIGAGILFLLLEAFTSGFELKRIIAAIIGVVMIVAIVSTLL
jgi:hypothetical protein